MGMPRKPCHACHAVTFHPPTDAAQLRKICSPTDAQKSVLPNALHPQPTALSAANRGCKTSSESFVSSGLPKPPKPTIWTDGFYRGLLLAVSLCTEPLPPKIVVPCA